MTRAPSVEKPASSGSSPVTSKLALKPAETPANEAAIPASGGRPAAWYSAAAKGGRTM